MKKNIYIIIALVVTVILGLTISHFIKEKEIQTEEFSVIDYYPKSGPVGSYVSLKLNAPATEDVEALYDGKGVSAEISEDVIRIAVPQDAESGDIQIKLGDAVSKLLPFSVKKTELITLTSETVKPSSELQTINYNDEITVAIPAGLLDKESTLTISEMKNAPPNSINDIGDRFLFDVSIEGMEQLDDYIEIGVKYDPNMLNPDHSPEDQLIAMRWNEEGKYWVNLPVRVDTQNKTLYMITDHLTGFEWAIIAGVFVATKPITWALEKVLNDVYITPGGNFRLLYDEDDINKDIALNDNIWVSTIYPGQNRINYSPNYPKCIQDVGNLFETAYENYMNLGFKDPVMKEGFWTGKKYRDPIIVKIDSFWLAVTKSPNYEKVNERIHIPSIRLKEAGTMKKTIGHELFHRFQEEYYLDAELMFSSNGWWIEATAEYAGHNVAWNQKIPGLEEYIGPDFLNYSITTTGEIKTPGWSDKRHEYASALWIRFLVEDKGLNFKELSEYVAEGSPLERLDSFFKTKGGDLASYYNEFATGLIFDYFTFFEKYPIASFSDDPLEITNSFYGWDPTLSDTQPPPPISNPPDIADRKDSISIPMKTPSLSIESGGGSPGITVKISRSEGDRFHSASNNFIASLPESNKFIIRPKNAGGIKDRIYLLATNGTNKDGSFNVTVRPINETTGEEGEAINHTFELEACSAKLWVVRAELDLNFKIKGRIFPGTYSESAKVEIVGGEFEATCSDRGDGWGEIKGVSNGSFEIHADCGKTEPYWQTYPLHDKSLTGKVSGIYHPYDGLMNFIILYDPNKTSGLGFNGTFIDGKAASSDSWNLEWCNKGVPFNVFRWEAEIVE
ncbi:hypothetical protein KAR26_04085 [Candidatus Parcubacteria bacterium]|nr:hypothetical protein [Candidatus Parcubacteria bacterium]